MEIIKDAHRRWVVEIGYYSIKRVLSEHLWSASRIGFEDNDVKSMNI
jgi:hypothetical protein